jgi:hypothetical protein
MVHGPPPPLPALLALGAGSSSKIIPRISRARGLSRLVGPDQFEREHDAAMPRVMVATTPGKAAPFRLIRRHLSAAVGVFAQGAVIPP